MLPLFWWSLQWVVRLRGKERRIFIAKLCTCKKINRHTTQLLHVKFNSWETNENIIPFLCFVVVDCHCFEEEKMQLRVLGYLTMVWRLTVRDFIFANGSQQHWCSGNILAFQAGAPGSIPGWCKYSIFSCSTLLFLLQSLKANCNSGRETDKAFPWVYSQSQKPIKEIPCRIVVF